MSELPVEILLVEDNPSDVELTREAMLDLELPHHLNVVYNGEDAVQAIRREGRFADWKLPDIILLDLNLPRMNGFEVLEEIKGESEHASIPIIILSTSEAKTDIDKAYALHANCYLKKPIELDEFIELFNLFNQFWLNRARLPGLTEGEGQI